MFKCDKYVRHGNAGQREANYAEFVDVIDGISDLDLSWLAGFLEGEGCFGTNKSPNARNAVPRVTVVNTDQDVVRRAAALMGVTNVTDRIPSPGCKRVYVASTSGRRAILLMRLLLPLMGERRSRRITELLVEFAEVAA